MAGRADRLTVPSSFIASAVTLAVSGTCFTQTTLSYGTVDASANRNQWDPKTINHLHPGQVPVAVASRASLADWCSI